MKCGVWFPEAVDFKGVRFSTIADFSHATFSAPADFTNATFSTRARFHAVIFGADASFHRANFHADANFRHATFSADTDFLGVNFNADTSFRYSSFRAATNFRYATFADYVRFAGNKDHSAFKDHPVFSDCSYLDLQYPRIEKPERVSFHTLMLRPHWFINVDAHKFEFVNVQWPSTGLMPEIESLRNRGVSSPYRLLAIAYRQLAVNAEENHRYREAAEFRYGSMDLLRLEQWRGMVFWRLAWWYWLVSGYGERITLAAVCLLLIIVLFAGLYTQVGFVRPADLTPKPTVTITTPDTVDAPLRFTQALVHSFEVSILQKPEPKPLTLIARFLVGLETVLGPLQAALLALAIRRKFMR